MNVKYLEPALKDVSIRMDHIIAPVLKDFYLTSTICHAIQPALMCH